MSNEIVTSSQQNPFDFIRRVDEHGHEYWSARELMPLLGYSFWQKFKAVIEIASENVEILGGTSKGHFLPVEVKSQGRPSLDYRLSRLAAYHVALSCDSRGNDQVKAAKHYFVVKTREAEVTAQQSLDEIIEVHQPVDRVMPTRDAIDYANAAKIAADLPDGLLKKLINNLLIDQISLDQNLKYLPVAEKPKQYTIVKIRAKALGYSEAQINNGSGLGKFVKSRVEPAFLENIGIYNDVAHYEITPALDAAIRAYFDR